MSQKTVSISKAIEVLQAHLMQVATVTEWSDMMGFKDPKVFSTKFQRFHAERPQKVLEFIRIQSIIRQLKRNNTSNFEVAQTHGIPDEVALNKFTNYHLGCSPTDIKCMSEEQLQIKLETFGSKIRYRISSVTP
ncbi:MAG TPA: hypothetical protein VKA08_08290 [Balneolales bacterium]|nr:hypothetical protein [Balneolales bacterium]